ncbi:MAG: hypothetical protein GX362_00695 [Methanosarcinaceae archaeon]|nr:hypothetical protein [Methanosarcinaceae archaeon]
MKKELISILLNMFHSYGYETSSCDFCDIHGRKGSYELYVMCDTEGDLDILERFTNNVSGKNSLYITTKKIKGGADALEQYARETGVVIWDRNMLAENVGTFFIDNLKREDTIYLLGNCILDSIDSKKKTDFLSFLARFTAQNENQRNINVINENIKNINVRNIINFEAENESIEKTISVSETAEKIIVPEKDIILEKGIISEKNTVSERNIMPERNTIPEKIQIIATPTSKINMSLEKAESLGRSLMGDVSETVLKFIPYWNYTYSININRKFDDEIVEMSESGSGFINAINGEFNNIEFGEIENQTEIPDIQYEQRQPEITKENIRVKIIEDLIRKNTKEIKTNITNAQVVMSQSKVFKPKESDIILKIKLVFAPIWELKGKRRSIEINAYNGETLDKPADDGVEFV